MVYPKNSVYDFLPYTETCVTITHVGNFCEHKNGYYAKVNFWIFSKKIFVCEDCREVIYGK